MKSQLKTLTLMLAMTFISGLAFAQNVEFTKENFKTNKDLKKIYRMHVKKGDKWYYQHERGYLLALEYYLQANEKHPNSALLNFKIADCFLHTLYKYRALPYALKAVELNPSVRYDADYVLGMAYHQVKEFDKAIECYNRFKSSYSGKDNDSLLMVAKRIEECNNAKQIVGEELYEVKNLGPVVNTPYAEYVPLVRADESYMIYTARRPQNMDTSFTTKRDKDKLAGFDLEYYEDIFRSDRQKDSTWGKPYRFDYFIARSGAHDATVSLSHDGLTIFTYRGNNNGDLYSATIENSKWSKAAPLDGINSKYREDHITLAHDNKTAYFVSDRPGGFGGKDIWKAVKGDDGKWGTPINLGPTINTPYDEDGPFIHPDGKTMYFSSKGHNTIGGYDVFETTFDGSNWSTPLNMGYPINSPDDDVFFVLTANGRDAYLSSVKEGGYGMQDIYCISPFKKKSKETFDLVVFKGFVVDKENKTHLNAKVDITDNSTGEKIYSAVVDAERGFLVSLPAGKEGKNYGISVEVDGYLFYSENFDLVAKDGFKEFEKTIEMEKVKPGSVLVLHNLFFDFDKSDLKSESISELDHALKVLNSQPGVKIQIEGHTDNVGADAYNKTLSEKRANAVKEYLVSKGFDAARIVKVVGFGEEKPADTNDTPEGRAHNRRVEFRLVE